eukprot:1478430-Amphidinium_carterae.3
MNPHRISSHSCIDPHKRIRSATASSHGHGCGFCSIDLKNSGNIHCDRGELTFVRSAIHELVMPFTLSGYAPTALQKLSCRG